jgi:hypothetical protein
MRHQTIYFFLFERHAAFGHAGHEAATITAIGL